MLKLNLNFDIELHADIVFVVKLLNDKFPAFFKSVYVLIEAIVLRWKWSISEI